MSGSPANESANALFPAKEKIELKAIRKTLNIRNGFFIDIYHFPLFLN
ncbi:hypothetical protein B4070_4427 [Bacillus subtilis]|nr:hypothetical protein B4070_4427 [Bacillus subtilis]